MTFKSLVIVILLLNLSGCAWFSQEEDENKGIMTGRSKPEYGKAIADSKKLEDANEAVLKAAIETVKETVTA